MKVTVVCGELKKSHIFKEGLLAGEIIAQLGFDFSMPCGGNGRCGKCRCRINGREALACQALLFSDSTIELYGGKEAVLTATGEELRQPVNGTVIDIGTTTVAAATFKDGKLVKSFGCKNPQCAFGADVISRIGARNTAPLTESVCGLVRKIRSDLGGDCVITGNTAMLALLTGMDTKQMGTYPFTPPSNFDTYFEGAYLPPCVSAFVGADALCGVLWSGADEREETALVIDLGTNAELCLKYGGRFFFTSAAAGPALEGANISCGMSAAEGAVYKVGKGGARVIGGGAPKGLCGSGLVDAVALLLNEGKISSFGAVDSPVEICDSGLFLTQEDIRAYQLCKAAVAAAVQALLKRAGIGVGQVDKIYLSGALGKNIDVANAVKTGLLPAADIGKFAAIGNGALLGGAMLLGAQGRQRIRDIAAKSESMELGTDAEFMQDYIQSMNF